MAAFATGLEDVTGGLAEAQGHMLGQFWSSEKGMQGAGRALLATTGAALHSTSDVAGDVRSVCGLQSRLQLLEEAREVCEDSLQAEVARRRTLIARMD